MESTTPIADARLRKRFHRTAPFSKLNLGDVVSTADGREGVFMGISTYGRRGAIVVLLYGKHANDRRDAKELPASLVSGVPIVVEYNFDRTYDPTVKPREERRDYFGRPVTDPFADQMRRLRDMDRSVGRGRGGGSGYIPRDDGIGTTHKPVITRYDGFF